MSRLTDLSLTLVLLLSRFVTRTLSQRSWILPLESGRLQHLVPASLLSYQMRLYIYSPPGALCGRSHHCCFCCGVKAGNHSSRCREPGPLFLGPPLDPAEPSGVGCLGVRQGLSPVLAQPLREGVGRNPQDTPRAVGVLLPHLKAYV